jgi:transposase
MDAAVVLGKDLIGLVSLFAARVSSSRRFTVRTGRCHLDAALPGILEDAAAALSGVVRFLLFELKQELDQLAGHLDEAKALIERAAQQNEACQRLDAIQGIGALTATALIAAIGNGGAFRKGREFAAWVVLVPREHSTGGMCLRSSLLWPGQM